MGWSLTLPVPDADPVEISEADLTAGEWAFIYELVAKAVPHDEAALHPMHCPLCRNAVALTALTSRAGVRPDIATQLVSQASRVELLAAVSVSEDD